MDNGSQVIWPTSNPSLPSFLLSFSGDDSFFCRRCALLPFSLWRRPRKGSFFALCSLLLSAPSLEKGRRVGGEGLTDEASTSRDGFFLSSYRTILLGPSTYVHAAYIRPGIEIEEQRLSRASQTESGLIRTAMSVQQVECPLSILLRFTRGRK